MKKLSKKPPLMSYYEINQTHYFTGLLNNELTTVFELKLLNKILYIPIIIGALSYFFRIGKNA